MSNLIERFIEDTGNMNIYTITDRGNRDYREIYFFMGKKAVLCIDKKEDRVIYNIHYDNLQIHIINANEFCFNIGDKSLFFYQGKDIKKGKANQESAEKEKFKKAVAIVEESNSRFRFKEICDRCENKICSQYDTINGREFKFGTGPISEDLLQQYDKYCEKKIQRFNCA